MKIFYTLILCLCAISAYSQTKGINSTDGTYIFQKATFTTYNYDSKAEVGTHVIDDPKLVTPNELFYYRNLFLEASIHNGELNYCMLFDHSRYKVQFATELIFMDSKEQVLPEEIHTQLTPYSLSINDNILTFTVDIPYGDSRYSFPLEGKLILTMTKQ